METAACKTTGYIMDGYPRNYADAKSIFLEANEAVSHEQENVETAENPFPGFTVNAEILP